MHRREQLNRMSSKRTFQKSDGRLGGSPLSVSRQQFRERLEFPTQSKAVILWTRDKNKEWVLPSLTGFSLLRLRMIYTPVFTMGTIGVRGISFGPFNPREF